MCWRLHLVFVATVTLNGYVSGAPINAGNGHFYERVDDSSINWQDANIAARGLTVQRHLRYLNHVHPRSWARNADLHCVDEPSGAVQLSTRI
jgi:hypothetical protein